MGRYLMKRLGQSVILLLIIISVVFYSVRLTGDPVMLLVAQDASEEDIANIRKSLGLDKSLPVQFWLFLSKGVRGDFGKSIWWHAPALGMVLERFPATFLLGGTAMLFALIIAIPVGMISAIKRGTVVDNFGKVIALIGNVTFASYSSRTLM